MQISNVVTGLSDATTWGKKSETAVKAGTSAIKSLDSLAQANPTAQKASVDVLRQYDITNITPDSYSQMIQKLYKAGAISEKDYQDLAAVRSDLDKAGIEPDESINMLEFCSDKLSKTQRNLSDSKDQPANQQSLGTDARRLDWMQKFAMIQANPDAVGLDVAG